MERQTTRRSLVKAGIASLAVTAISPLASAATAQTNAPAIEIITPASGAKVTSADIPVQIKVSNFKVDCAEAGRPDQPGVGHVHVMVGGTTMAQLINFYCRNEFVLPGTGFTPGKLTIYVALAGNSHAAMMDTMKSVDIDFAPANPVALPKPDFTGAPGVELVSPNEGATVPSTFPVTVKPVNFHPDAALEGKTNVPGYGHYHVFVDTPMGHAGMAMGTATPGMMETPASGMMGTPMTEMAGGMMSMAGMVLMPGSNSFSLDLSAWGKGEHTIWIEPVQNDHTQYQEFGHVQFKVNVQ